MCKKVPLQYTAFPRLNAQAFSVKVGSHPDLEKGWEPVLPFASSRPSFTNGLSSVETATVFQPLSASNGAMNGQNRPGLYEVGR